MQPNIFFHLGTERTGTTYLQDKIFPLFRNVSYIHKKQFGKHGEVIQKSNDPVLISYEFGRNFEEEVPRFAKKYPDTKPIIVFRKHGQYLKSQYKRYLKNGYKLSFSEFFNLEQPSLFSVDEVYYLPMIEYLETHFNHPPLVLLYDDMRQSPKAFIRKIADYAGADINLPESLPGQSHKSYSERQLKFLLWAYQSFTSKSQMRFNAKWLRYIFLYLAYIFPERQSELIPDDDLQSIDAFFQEDWEECTKRATHITSKTGQH